MAAGKAARNERRRLVATASNNVAVAFVVTGVVAPLVSGAYNLGIPDAKYPVALGLGWLAAAAILHVIARWSVGGLED